MRCSGSLLILVLAFSAVGLTQPTDSVSPADVGAAPAVDPSGRKIDWNIDDRHAAESRAREELNHYRKTGETKGAPGSVLTPAQQLYMGPARAKIQSELSVVTEQRHAREREEFNKQRGTVYGARQRAAARRNKIKGYRDKMRARTALQKQLANPDAQQLALPGSNSQRTPLPVAGGQDRGALATRPEQLAKSDTQQRALSEPNRGNWQSVMLENGLAGPRR